jgi:hypothetical protein
LLYLVCPEKSFDPPTLSNQKGSNQMKNIVRAFVLALAITGAFATTHANASSATTVTAKTSAMPVPSCPPSDPNGCGIADAGW